MTAPGSSWASPDSIWTAPGSSYAAPGSSWAALSTPRELKKKPVLAWEREARFILEKLTILYKHVKAGLTASKHV